MEKIEKILVAVEQNAGARDALIKAVTLSRRFGAQLDLFLCDAERAFALDHQYFSCGVEPVRQSCLTQSLRYLEDLRASVDTSGVRVMIDAACESPQYAAIARRIGRTQPDLVVRNVSGAADARGVAAPGVADLDLVRTCVVPLLLTRGTPWAVRPRIAAAIDITAAETPHLAQEILREANYLSGGCDGEIEVFYSDPDPAHARDAQALEAQRIRLRNVVEEAGVPADLTHVLVGDPVQAIPKFVAARKYDVLALGALTHRETLSALLGSLTNTLLDTPVCDFLLVKPRVDVSALAAIAPVLQSHGKSHAIYR